MFSVILSKNFIKKKKKTLFYFKSNANKIITEVWLYNNGELIKKFEA